jgi:hypothetical protein
MAFDALSGFTDVASTKELTKWQTSIIVIKNLH